jgi:hypothetical protein
VPALTKCPSCGNEVSTVALACPKCGHQFKSPGAFSMKDPVHAGCVIAVGGFLVLAVLLVLTSGAGSPATKAPSTAKAPDPEAPKSVALTPGPEAAREARERLARQKVLDGLSNPTNPTQADIDLLRRNAIRNNVTMDGFHKLEQLVYPNDVYIYLRDGRVEMSPPPDESEIARLRLIRTLTQR